MIRGQLYHQPRMIRPLHSLGQITSVAEIMRVGEMRDDSVYRPSSRDSFSPLEDFVTFFFNRTGTLCIGL